MKQKNQYGQQILSEKYTLLDHIYKIETESVTGDQIQILSQCRTQGHGQETGTVRINPTQEVEKDP